MQGWLPRNPNGVRRGWSASSGASLAVWLAVTGCSASDEVEKQLDTVSSWTATMQLAAVEHRSHAVTAIYVTQLTDAAGAVLTDARRSLARAAHGESDNRHMSAALDSLEHAIRDLEAESRR
jgi:hypothetical protein